MNAKTILWVLLVIGGALIVRDLFPKRERIVLPVRFVTIHDTVAKLDTIRLSKLIHDVHPDTVWLERWTVTKPETVTVVPALTGVTGLYVPPTFGDTMLAQGFHIRPLGDGHYAVNRWLANFYAAGPLAGLQLVGDTLKAAFYPLPKPPCGFLCSAKKYVLGGGVGYLACAVRK